MPKFFVDLSAIAGNQVQFTGENYQHLSKVLRAKIGDAVVATDAQGMDYHCVIDHITSDCIVARIEDVARSAVEPEVAVHLFQCLPKADKMELVIQKCVELGVHKIYPVAAARCVVRLDTERAQKKCARWQKVSEAAAKQCGRGIIPEIHSVISMDEAIELAAAMDLALIPYEREQQRGLKEIALGGRKEIAILIGPEGGFDDAEIAACLARGILPVTLGKRILRTETAGMYTLAILLYLIENM